MPLPIPASPLGQHATRLFLGGAIVVGSPGSPGAHGGYFERQEGVIVSPHLGFTASSEHRPDAGFTASVYSGHEFTQMPFYHHPPGMPGNSWGPQLAWPGIGMGLYRLDGSFSAEVLLKAGIGEFPRPNVHWGIGGGLALHDEDLVLATEVWTVFLLGWRWKATWLAEPRHTFTVFFPFVVARP